MHKYVLLLFYCVLTVNAQKGLSIPVAKEQGITVEHLDSIYKSAVHSEPAKAVFKTEAEQQKLAEAYVKFLTDFGSFLLKNHFKWENATRGWNRIYIAPNGKIDYFLYSLRDLPAEKEQEFNRLLNLYVKDHKFPITAPVKFAQCSPVTYPKSE
jgi:hypothetical protein